MTAVAHPSGQAAEPRSECPRSSPEGALRLRLWLAGFHTPSLNVTKGTHWTVYFGLKQNAAAALVKGLDGIVAQSADADRAIAQAKRVLVGIARPKMAVARAASGKGAGDRVGGGRSPAVGLARLRYVRVTCQPLDVENWVGSTKALTDCLKMAFPEILPDDAPEYVHIEHRQERCRKRCEEGTWVWLARDEGGGEEDGRAGGLTEN